MNWRVMLTCNGRPTHNHQLAIARKFVSILDRRVSVEIVSRFDVQSFTADSIVRRFLNKLDQN